jgi:hypothetical protein
MTFNGRHPRVPGTRLRALAQRLVDRHTLERVVDPAIADLQHVTASPARGWHSRRARFSAMLGCLLAICFGLFSRRSMMRFWTRTGIGALSVIGVVAVSLVGIHLPAPHFIVAILAAASMVPFVLLAVAVGAWWNFRLAAQRALVIIPAGFLVGGLVGWRSVPAEWTASLWQTIDASMNAVKYGHAYEHTAEQALMYFFLGGVTGTIPAALVSVGVTWYSTHSSRRSTAPESRA